jgi:hypothetical protein
MNLKLEQIFDNIIISGDIHGDIMPLINKVNDQHKISNSLIIVAGDVGIGFHADGYYTHLFKKAEARLKKNNNILLFVRGNHDDPNKWNDYEPFKSYWQEGDKNIRFIKDYTVLNIESAKGIHNILCVGGALSIDRKPNSNVLNMYGKPWPGRTVGLNYWLGEPFVYDESKIEALTGITDVITHSSPNFCEPLIKNGIEKWIQTDDTLEADCNKERNDHTLLYNKLKEKNKIQSWHYGHFHFSNRMYIDDTKFRLCDIMELAEL